MLAYLEALEDVGNAHEFQDQQHHEYGTYQADDVAARGVAVRRAQARPRGAAREGPRPLGCVLHAGAGLSRLRRLPRERNNFV